MSESRSIAASSLTSQVVSSVRYVGLDYPDHDADVAWDFGAWHWPEVAVEIRTASDRVYSAVWDSPPQFTLAFVEQPIIDLWLPARDVDGGRSWDVSAHPRWSPFIGRQVTRCDLAFAHLEGGPEEVPVAVRLQAASGTAWVAAIAPGDVDPVTGAFDPGAAFVGADEVIVIFDDGLAREVGLDRIEPPA
jgi:hypothetical protein